MTKRTRLLRAGLLSATLVALAGCGGGSKTGTSGATTAVSASGVPTAASSQSAGFASATAERDKLLALAKRGTRITSQGTVPGWPPANGSAIPATATEISGFSFSTDKGAGVQYLSFAVSDSNHTCAGGDIVANSKGTVVTFTKPVKLPAHAPCTGDQVATQAGHMGGGP